MSLIRRANAVVWTFLMALILLMPQDSFGHSLTTYAPHRWLSSSVDWRFTPSYPAGQLRGRVIDAADRWNAVTGVAFSFNFTGEGQNGQQFGNPCANDYNAIFYGTQAEFGGTKHCFGPPSLGEPVTRFSLVIDSTKSWITAPGGSGAHWLESTATHELGHAWGFGTGVYDFSGLEHFDRDLPICNDDASYHTMCIGLRPVPQKTMSLEQHDIETFQDRY